MWFYSKTVLYSRKKPVSLESATWTLGFSVSKEDIMDKAEICKKWRERNAERVLSYRKTYNNEHKSERQLYRKEWQQKLRQQVLAFLGGRCSVCGETDWRMLQIDHIHGNGTADPFRKAGAVPLYRAILMMENPHKVYQILCANHNWVKKYEEDENASRLPENKFLENG